MLHWGVGRKSPHEWTFPDESIWPENSKEFDKIRSALRSTFSPDKKEEGYKSIHIDIAADNLKIQGMTYVIFDGKTNRWYNNNGMNYKVNFNERQVRLTGRLIKGSSAEVVNIVNDIITCETTYNSWTLMHRYKKCSDLLNKIKIDSAEEV